MEPPPPELGKCQLSSIYGGERQKKKKMNGYLKENLGTLKGGEMGMDAGQPVLATMYKVIGMQYNELFYIYKFLILSMGTF